MSEIFIRNTIYGEYFDNAVKNIYLLEENEASNIWIKFIDRKSYNFYKIKDENPIILSARNIGDWRDYYDENKLEDFQLFISTKLDWDIGDQVFFCINKEVIIKTTYSIFLENIFNFLELYDDCPILFNDRDNYVEYIYFASLGRIFLSVIDRS